MLHTTVKTWLTKIGNSQGIRIPKPVLEQLGFAEEVELDILPDQLIIRSPHLPRRHWAEQFKAMAEAGDDQLLDEEATHLSSWGEEAWEW